jgi:hypothetical protein
MTELQPETRVRIAERLKRGDWTDDAHLTRLAGAGQEAVVATEWYAGVYRVELDSGPLALYHRDELTPVVAEPAEPDPEALLQKAQQVARTFRVWNDLPDTFPTPEMLDALHEMADLLDMGVDCGGPDGDTPAPQIGAGQEIADQAKLSEPVRRLLEAHTAEELRRVAKGLRWWSVSDMVAPSRSVAEVLELLAELKGGSR